MAIVFSILLVPHFDCFAFFMVVYCQSLSKTRTYRQTDAMNRIWCILASKCDITWQYFNDFLDNQVTPVDPGLSDHFLVMSDVSIGCPKPQLQRFSYRDFRAVDPEVFATHLQMTDV